MKGNNSWNIGLILLKIQTWLFEIRCTCNIKVVFNHKHSIILFDSKIRPNNRNLTLPRTTSRNTNWHCFLYDLKTKACLTEQLDFNGLLVLYQKPNYMYNYNQTHEILTTYFLISFESYPKYNTISKVSYPILLINLTNIFCSKFEESQKDQMCDKKKYGHPSQLRLFPITRAFGHRK